TPVLVFPSFFFNPPASTWIYTLSYTTLFRSYGDPVHARGLHGDGADPALLQPSGHRLQLRGGAPEASYRLAVSARRYRRIVGFVANINACGIGMDHFQAEVFALDLPHGLPPLLAVHLVPMVLCWMVGCSFVFLLWFGFHANLPTFEFDLARPGWRKLLNLLIGVRAILLFRTTPATIYIIATTGAMLLFGQERSRENAALAAEPGRNGDSK